MTLTFRFSLSGRSLQTERNGLGRNFSLCLSFSIHLYIYTHLFIMSVSAPSVQTNNHYCANRNGRREGLFTFRTQPFGPARKQSGTGRRCRTPGVAKNHRNNPQKFINIRSNTVLVPYVAVAIDILQSSSTITHSVISREMRFSKRLVVNSKMFFVGNLHFSRSIVD